MRLVGMPIAIVLVALAACGGDDDIDPGAGEPETITVTSTEFVDGGGIPADFTCDGRDHSPPLRWGERTGGVASLAVIMDDLDADFVHWVAYDMNKELAGIDFIGKTETFPGGGGDQGTNGFGEFGYGGPCPPEGETHTYRFRVFALAEMVDLEPGATADELEAAMEGIIHQQGELTGTYGR